MQQVADIEQDYQEQQFEKMLIMDRRFNKEIAKFLKEVYRIQELPNLASQLRHKDPIVKHRAVIGIRKILLNSTLSNNSIQQVIDMGVIPQVIFLAKQIKYPHLRLEAAYALALIMRGSYAQCQQVINRGGILAFIRILQTKKLKLIELAICGIRNIVKYQQRYRDMLIERGAIDKIVKNVKNISNQRLILLCCWTISSLCRGLRLPRSELIKSGVLFLCDAVAKQKLKDLQIISDCCWVISQHFNHVLTNKEDLFSSLVHQLIPLCCKNQLMMTLQPVMRIFRQASASTEFINILIQQKTLSLLNKLLNHQKKVVRREACWMISNIAAGSQEQTYAVSQEDGLIMKLADIFENDVVDLKQQVCTIFANLARRGDPSAVCSIYAENNIAGLCYRLFEQKDRWATKIALQSIDYIVSFASKFSKQTCSLVLGQLRREGAPQGLQKLECSQSDLVIDIVNRLLIAFNEQRNCDD